MDDMGNMRNIRKASWRVLKIFPILLLVASWQTSFAQACATAERTQNINFFQGSSSAVNVAGLNINGWLGSGTGTVLSGNSTYFSNDNNSQTFTQSITGANLKGNGAVFTLVFTSFNGSNNDIVDGDRANFVISYGGIVYATMATTDGSGLIGTITFSNGATGSINGGSAGSGALNFVISDVTIARNTLVLHLPATIANSGNLQMQFQPFPAGSSLATDDYNIFTASLKACPIIYSGTIFDDGNGLKDGEDLKLFAGYTYTDARATYLQQNQVLPLMPKHKINAVIMYEKEDNFKLGLEGYHTGSQYLYNGFKTPSFWEFGFMAQKTFGQFSLFVNFENFTDQRQSNYKRVVNAPFDNPTFDDIWNHTEGRTINGGIKIKL